MSSNSVILQTNNLSKTYKIGKLEVPALREVSLDVNRGEFVAIMGPSGCGKSTLLHLLGGLLSPTSGSIFIDGEDLSKVSDAKRTDIRRRKIGFVFQRFNLFPTLTADGNLKLAEKIHDRVLAVDGVPLIENGYVYQQRTLGPECSSSVFTVQSPGGSVRKVAIVRYRVSAPLPVVANLVPTRDGSRIGYIFIPTFLDSTIPDQIKKALDGFGELDGLIIDNRMNGGGSSSVLMPTLGFFTSGTVGHFISRTGKRPMEIQAKPVHNSQSVPLVVLIGKDTVSYAEVFSGVLQDLGRAKIVGQTSRGNVETLRGHNFPDGSQAWIAQESFQPIRSKVGWEKNGVKPDVEAHAEWDTFTFETDPGVTAAVKLLRSNQK